MPWHAIHDAFPPVFVVVALGGIFLDLCLCVSLGVLPPGHPLQSVALLFHGFTVRSRKRAVIYFGWVFYRPLSRAGQSFETVGWQDTHIYRVFTIFKRMSSWGVMAFLVFQWAMPMRMPIISNGDLPFN